MESTRAKVEVMKPVILKAGIPLVLSMAGFIYAKIVASRRNSTSKASSTMDQTQVSSRESDSSDENESQIMITTKNTQFMNLSMEALGMEEEEEVDVLDLKQGIIEGLEGRVFSLEMRFLRYIDLKDQEFMLMELRNMILLEMVRVEFLEKEVSLMEDEYKRFEKLVLEYVKALEEIEYWKVENGVVHRKVRRLLKREKALSRIVRAKNLEIEGREAEVWRNREEIEKRNGVIMKLEDEVGELHSIVHELLEEKNCLLKELELAKNVSKIEANCVTKEDYDKLLNELELLQKDRGAEVKELIFLRWSNACLRHELMRNREQGKENMERKTPLELDAEGIEETKCGLVTRQDETCLAIVTSNQACSRKRNFIQKFKKWTEKK